jgi:hypothetical protein
MATGCVRLAKLLLQVLHGFCHYLFHLGFNILLQLGGYVIMKGLAAGAYADAFILNINLWMLSVLGAGLGFQIGGDGFNVYHAGESNKYFLTGEMLTILIGASGKFERRKAATNEKRILGRKRRTGNRENWQAYCRLDQDT